MRLEECFVWCPVDAVFLGPSFIQALLHVLHATKIECVEFFGSGEGVIDGLFVLVLVQLELHGHYLKTLCLLEVAPYSFSMK